MLRHGRRPTSVTVNSTVNVTIFRPDHFCTGATSPHRNPSAAAAASPPSQWLLNDH